MNIVGSSQFCQQSAAGLHELSAGLMSHRTAKLYEQCACSGENVEKEIIREGTQLFLFNAYQQEDTKLEHVK